MAIIEVGLVKWHILLWTAQEGKAKCVHTLTMRILDKGED